MYPFIFFRLIDQHAPANLRPCGRLFPIAHASCRLVDADWVSVPKNGLE
jgi:hypothetical protein